MNDHSNILVGVIESTFSMVFGVPFQFSSQYDSKITIMTEEEAAAIRATEMFKLAQRRDSEPPLPHPPSLQGHSRSSDPGQYHSTDHNHDTRTSRSQSDDINLYTNSGPLNYEEEELIHHREKQHHAPPQPPSSSSNLLPSQKSSSNVDESMNELLTHNEEEEGLEQQHHHEL